jgi:hypothetical protein
MLFIVRAATNNAEILIARDTAVAALQKADELLGEGVADVRVSLGDGCRYGPAEFDRVHELYEPDNFDDEAA